MRPTQDAKLVFSGFIPLPNPLTGGPFRLMAGISDAVLAITRIILTNTDPANANAVQFFTPDSLTNWAGLEEQQPAPYPSFPLKVSLPAGGSYIWNANDQSFPASPTNNQVALLLYPTDILAAFAKNSPPNLTVPNQAQPTPSLVYCNVFAIVHRNAVRARPHYQEDVLDESINGLRDTPDLYVHTTEGRRDLQVIEPELQELMRKMLVELKRIRYVLADGFDIDLDVEDQDSEELFEEAEQEDQV